MSDDDTQEFTEQDVAPLSEVLSTPPAPDSIPDEDRVRYEDDSSNFPSEEEEEEPVELSAEEVPLEESRKDETSVLATDQFDQDGNRVT